MTGVTGRLAGQVPLALARPPSKTSHLFSARKPNERAPITHERVAEDIEAFRKAGGKIEVLGVTRAALSSLLNERSHLSPEMALRIEKAFGVSMDTLMRMQNSYDIARTRKRAGEINVTRFSEELRSTGH